MSSPWVQLTFPDAQVNLPPPPRDRVNKYLNAYTKKQVIVHSTIGKLQAKENASKNKATWLYV